MRQQRPGQALDELALRDKHLDDVAAMARVSGDRIRTPILQR